eukprot:2704247-Rhodomonas_salina.1
MPVLFSDRPIVIWYCFATNDSLNLVVDSVGTRGRWYGARAVYAGTEFPYGVPFGRFSFPTGSPAPLTWPLRVPFTVSSARL